MGLTYYEIRLNFEFQLEERERERERERMEEDAAVAMFWLFNLFYLIVFIAGWVYYCNFYKPRYQS